MRRRRDRSYEIKTPAQLALMREAGLVVAAALSATVRAVEPGISTAELDAIAERVIRDAGAVPSFKGYQGFPATICTSVNDEVVHGIPRPEVRLAAGDLISVDCGAIVGGWHGDAAVTVGVGPLTPAQSGLLETCERALWQGLSHAVAGGRLSDISAAVEATASAPGEYGIVEDYVGHGIGSQMHMDPPVPNYGRPGRGPLLVEGMALAVEPMLVLGDPQTRLLADDWTVVTEDGSRAAHFEHTVAITADGPWVLTAPDGGPRRPGGNSGRQGRSGPRACPRRGRRDGELGRIVMAASDPNIRASDDDRDRTASLLREHHAVGRLTPEEFNERLDKTFAAKTVGELDELLADLPAIDLYRLPDQALKRHRPLPGHSSALAAAASAGAPAMRQHGRLSPAWQAAWGSWISVSAVFIVIWALSGTGYPWFAWIIGPWGAVLIGRWISGGHPDGGDQDRRRGRPGGEDSPPRELPGDHD